MGVLLRRFGRDERGATAIEYGLIAGMIAIGLIAAFSTFGGSLSALFHYVQDKSTNAMAAAD
jgi:pilus assembly protein Flp/PilA